MTNPLRALTLAVARTRIGARVFSQVAHRVDRAAYRLTGGTLTGWLTGYPLIIAHTIGRKSGTRYDIPLLAIPHGDAYLLVASNFGRERLPGWYFNITAAGEVAATLEGATRTYTVTEIAGEAYPDVWAYLVEYAPIYTAYEKTLDGKRHIPLLALENKSVSIG